MTNAYSCKLFIPKQSQPTAVDHLEESRNIRCAQLRQDALDSRSISKKQFDRLAQLDMYPAYTDQGIFIGYSACSLLDLN